MRTIFLLGCAALALSACGSNDADEANTMAADNMMMDQNGAMTGTNMDGNVAIDPATQNMMMNDLTTNDADTNLANGM